MATKRDSDLTYAFSGVDIQVKAKFKSSFSKVRDWKANFVVVKKSLLIIIIEVKALTP